MGNRLTDLPVERFAAMLPAAAPVLGLDLGTRTIGLAISDVRRRIATPLLTIRRTKFAADAKALLDKARERQVGGLVLGLPINMDGSEGPRAQATRAFAHNLADRTDLPVLFWDERLSTAAVTRTLIAGDISRQRRGALVDKMAAAYILQGALDRMAGLQGQAPPAGGLRP